MVINIYVSMQSDILKTLAQQLIILDVQSR